MPTTSMGAAEQNRLLADVEAFCQELRPQEELCYVEHRFNADLIPLRASTTFLACRCPQLMAAAARTPRTYARALARIGQEGTGVRTFFSGHTSHRPISDHDVGQ